MESLHDVRADNGLESAGSSATQPPDSVIPQVLTSTQLHALFDILTHHETYAEVESFKDPTSVSKYGYPFARPSPQSGTAPTYSTDSAAPLLAGVLRSIVLTVPGVRDLPAEFWHVRFQGVLEKFAEAGLSEAYDKGALGTRKTLATAASAIHEAVSRGILGGVENDTRRNLQGEYDRSKADDLVRAWEDAVHELLYGDLVEELFTCAAERQSLEEHSPGVQAAADYVIIHLATLMHRVFVLAPDGPYMLKLLENVHKLLPYSMVKQTLRIGNVATMLNGMMRLLLAKMGVGALSNWVGLTQNADDGMNLLQRIIWLVLSWDSLESRKSADAIEKSKAGSSPSKKHLAAIKDYLEKPRKENDDARNASVAASKSMIATILEGSNPGLLTSLSETQHAQCQEYLSALLAARDRDEITKVLCRQNPDLFTQAIKDAVASFEPIIRTVHQRVDLREHVSAGEGFLTDFINVSKAKKGTSGLLGPLTSGGSKGEHAELPPSVEDYVILLRRNRQLLYNWLHQVASQCPDIRDDFCSWAKETVKVFRRSERATSQPQTDQESTPPEESNTTNHQPQRRGAAGALSSNLQHLFASLPASTRSRILPAIHAHASYLSTLEHLSLVRMQHILDNMSNNNNTANSTPTTPASTPSTPSYFSPAYWSISGKSSPISRSAASTPTPKQKPTTAATQPNNNIPNMSFSGPGMYLARWQQLLDDTLIAPASPRGGPLRRGRDVRAVLPPGKMGAGSGSGTGPKERGWDPTLLVAAVGDGEGEPVPPDVGAVVEALGEGFRELVGDLLKGGRGGGASGDVSEGR